MWRVVSATTMGAVILLASQVALSQSSTESIKVGWLGSLSGVLAPYGLENKRGVEFAVNTINAAGGVKGRKLEVIYVDSKFDSAFAVQSIQRFALQDKVVAILGDIASLNERPPGSAGVAVEV